MKRSGVLAQTLAEKILLISSDRAYVKSHRLSRSESFLALQVLPEEKMFAEVFPASSKLDASKLQKQTDGFSFDHDVMPELSRHHHEHVPSD